MCVRFSKDWLPYVLGGLFQLVNPSSWLVDDEPSLQEALERATALLDLFGQAGDCPPMDLRFTDGCVLQYSLDGGTTWLDVSGWTTHFPVCNPPQTQVKFDSDCLLSESFDGGESFEAVPGWAANFKDCVISNAPIIGLPPNPGDQLPDQFACSIAAYLADQVILLAMQKAVNAVQDDLTLLVFGANVLTLIPEFILVAAAYDAFASIYGFVAEGTLAHYEAAIADEALWQAVTCAIYLAIRSDGYVTPGNFGAIIADLGAISYTYSDVVTAIVGYVTSLGATGLAQLSQRAGLLVGSDCSTCGTWCYEWDFTIAPGPFTSYDPGVTSWVDGVGWVGTYRSGSANCQEAAIQLDFTEVEVTEADVSFISPDAQGSSLRLIFWIGPAGESTSGTYTDGSTSVRTQGVTIERHITEYGAIIRSTGNVRVNTITKVRFTGPGALPAEFTGGAAC